MRVFVKLALMAALVFIAGCQEEDVQALKPQAIALTQEAAGHYCQMVILEHQGPKAQVHLTGHEAPLWFSQVRDGLAYLKSAEKTAEVAAIYVNDMGKAVSWKVPGKGNWLDVDAAYFVVGSDAKGGMGAPEIVPFGDKNKAEQFAQKRGGTVKRLSDIPAEVVLAPVEFTNISQANTTQASPRQASPKERTKQ